MATLNFKGLSSLPKEEQTHIKSLIQYVLDRFFTKRLQNNLEIHLVFDKDLFQRERIYGDCIWEDQHYKPREFTVRIDSSQKLKMILNTLAHELTHVKQWAKGEMFELQLQRKVYRFRKEDFNTRNMDYWDLPWEVEAHGRAVTLLIQWAIHSKFTDKVANKLLIQ